MYVDGAFQTTVSTISHPFVAFREKSNRATIVYTMVVVSVGRPPTLHP